MDFTTVSAMPNECVMRSVRRAGERPREKAFIERRTVGHAKNVAFTRVPEFQVNEDPGAVDTDARPNGRSTSLVGRPSTQNRAKHEKGDRP